jgi:hypothetical protein
MKPKMSSEFSTYRNLPFTSKMQIMHPGTQMISTPDLKEHGS